MQTANQKVAGSNPRLDGCKKLPFHVRPTGSRAGESIIPASGSAHNHSWNSSICILASLFMISECVPLWERVCPLHPEAQG